MQVTPATRRSGCQIVCSRFLELWRMRTIGQQQTFVNVLHWGRSPKSSRPFFILFFAGYAV